MEKRKRERVVGTKENEKIRACKEVIQEQEQMETFHS